MSLLLLKSNFSTVNGRNRKGDRLLYGPRKLFNFVVHGLFQPTKFLLIHAPSYSSVNVLPQRQVRGYNKEDLDTRHILLTYTLPKGTRVLLFLRNVSFTFTFLKYPLRIQVHMT